MAKAMATTQKICSTSIPIKARLPKTNPVSMIVVVRATPGPDKKPTQAKPAIAARNPAVTMMIASKRGFNWSARRSNTAMATTIAPLAIQTGNMTTFTATGQAAGLIEKTQLHRVVTVTLLRAHLKHATRARLNDGDGDAIPRRIINLCHPDLAAEYSLGHR